MALTPIEQTITNLVYTRIVNNSASYLVQNSGNGMIFVAGSSTDLGATTATDLGGYKINPTEAIGNSQLKDYPYVYSQSVADNGSVRA